MWTLVLSMAIVQNVTFPHTSQTIGNFEVAKYATESQCLHNLNIMQTVQPTYTYKCINS